MRRHPRPGWLAFILATLLVAPAASPVAAQPRTDLVRMPFPQDDGSLTPYTFEAGYPLLTLVYDTLLWRDAKGIPQPWLARSVVESPDGRVLTIKLAEGVRWHDGAALSAADVAFTFHYVSTRFHPRFTPALRAVERVDALNPATVVITLRHPSLGFFDQPLADLPILPAHRWQGLAPGQVAPDGPPVGSGPYRLVRHRPGEGYRFEAYPGYFRGPPRVQAIEVPVVTDAEAMVKALEDRRVDMIPVSLPSSSAKRLEGLGIRVVEGPSYLGTVLMFNLRSSPFNRPELRQAVARVLDVERIAAGVGNALPAHHGYLHPASQWAPVETVSVSKEERSDPVSGFQVPPVNILAPNNDPLKLEAARQVVLALERAGLRARSEGIPRDDFARAVGEGESPPSFQAAIGVVPALASYDPDFLRRVFGSDPSEASLNYSGYRSPSFDDLAERINSTPDATVRRAAVGDALRLVATDAPLVPLFFSTGSYAYRPAIYDGWLFVTGTGILDKRSFLNHRARADGPGTGQHRPTPRRRLPLGLLSLGAAGVGVLVATGVALRRRTR